uniref:Thiol:disulfide interchange protein n=1 Tax=Polysiphonia sp. TaxID=1967842 RepID=A0A1Z1M438_9FLOR|nr:thiol:disulfide interchange protein [Polysiphonia sp.]
MIIILSLYDLFDTYYIAIYRIQQYLSSYFFGLSTSQSIFTSIFLFFLGFITLFTPCFISLLPLALSYVNSKSNYNFNILLFVIGLLTSFAFFIISTNLVSLSFFVYKLPIFSYCILLLVALDLMKILPFFYISSYLNYYIPVFSYNNTVLQSYFLGLIIGFSSLPCNTSILLIVMFLVKNISNKFFSFLYLSIYLSGSILPLLFILKVKLNYSKFSSLLFFWKLIFPMSGSFIFIYSCISLLKIIFI